MAAICWGVRTDWKYRISEMNELEYCPADSVTPTQMGAGPRVMESALVVAQDWVAPPLAKRDETSIHLPEGTTCSTKVVTALSENMS